MTHLKNENDLSKHFGDDIINHIFFCIENNCKEFKDKVKLPLLYGCFILKDVPKKNGLKTNIFVEYNVKVIPKVGNVHIFDAGLSSVIMFDEPTDYILDRYNLIKGIVET